MGSRRAHEARRVVSISTTGVDECGNENALRDLSWQAHLEVKSQCLACEPGGVFVASLDRGNPRELDQNAGNGAIVLQGARVHKHVLAESAPLSQVTSPRFLRGTIAARSSSRAIACR